MSASQIVTGLDVGTTKVAAVIAEGLENGDLSILGVGESPSYGLRGGSLVDLEATVEAIRTAVSQVEQMAGVHGRGVFAGVAGDVQRVVDAARTVAIPSTRDILHVIPQEFVVDDQTGIRDPVGMSGVRLEAEVHIITASATAVRNVAKAIGRAGYKVIGLVAEPMASAWSVLEEDERRLRTPLDAAEQIKLQLGCAMASLVQQDETIEIPGVGGRASRTVSRHVLAAIIEPRVEEILSLARAELEQLPGTEILAAGIVVTGGTAALRGVAEMAEQVFEMPARIGVPLGVGAMGDLAVDPRFATCVGLVRFGVTRGQGTGSAVSWRKESGLREWLRAHVPFMG
jgi:cell division protein FtsA